MRANLPAGREMEMITDKEIEQVADDEKQKDWDDLRYAEIYRNAFIDGAKWLRSKQIKVEPVVKPEIADIQKITMWVDIIWNDIFDDDELPLTAKQMNIIGRYINDAKEKIRQQFSV